MYKFSIIKIIWLSSRIILGIIWERVFDFILFLWTKALSALFRHDEKMENDLTLFFRPSSKYFLFIQGRIWLHSFHDSHPHSCISCCTEDIRCCHTNFYWWRNWCSKHWRSHVDDIPCQLRFRYVSVTHAVS